MDSSDENNIVDDVVDSVSDHDDTLEDVADDEVVAYDITLIDLRGKARLSVNVPLAIGTEAVDYVASEVEDQIDKRHATDQGRTVGELQVSGDGSIQRVEIKDAFKK